MYNRIILVGNLTREIDLRYTPSGTAVASCGIATSRKFKKQDGTQNEEVCFVDLTFFGRTGEVVNQYLNKGSKILVEGRLKLDTWTDNNGQKKSKHSVVVENMQMLNTKSNNTQTNQAPNQGYQQPREQPPVQTYQANPQGYQQPTQQMPTVDIDESEIPF